MIELPKKSPGAASFLRYLILTTSRAHPRKTGSFGEHDDQDPRGPFHHWADGAGRVMRVRHPDDLVIPDGICRSPAAVETCLHAEVVCFGGLYWASRTQTHGSNALPIAVANFRKWIAQWCADHKRPEALAVVGSWELGAEAYAAETLVDLVAEIRGQPPHYASSGRHMAFGVDLGSVEKQRAALLRLGFAVDTEDTNDSWSAKDQLALLEFQSTHRLRITGWWDPLTIGAVREALARHGVRVELPPPLPPSPGGAP